jgi:acetylornithine deacetylase/succinyl-diaminopimelate desuccinylase-like protein
MKFPFEAFVKWFEKHEPSIQSDFFHFLRFQSISTDPAFEKDCLQTAHWLSSYLQKVGMESKILPSSGRPAVFAKSAKEFQGAPTVLLYQHYDVQPVDPIDLWDSPPFEPVLKDGKVYARGASDNKGQCFLTLTALKAIEELLPDLPLNCKIFIEGEEESGGSGTGEILIKYKDLLKADYLGVIDFDIPSKDTPAISMGYRGLLALNIECCNAATDLHSGAHGGIALNPNRILIELLSKMWDETGRVTIPHFYDGIIPLSAEEKTEIDFSFDESKYKEEFGVGAFCSQEGISLKEANWIYPTLEVNGMIGGYTGAGFKTVIPAKARAKVSCRLVPGQDPEKIFEHFKEFVLKNTPKGAHMSVEWHHGAKAYRAPFSSRIAKATLKSMEEVFQTPCKRVLSGGAVPIAGELAKASGAEVAFFGFALDTDNIHAPNEHFHWECFKKGFMTVAKMLFELSRDTK